MTGQSAAPERGNAGDSVVFVLDWPTAAGTWRAHCVFAHASWIQPKLPSAPLRLAGGGHDSYSVGVPAAPEPSARSRSVPRALAVAGGL